MSTYTGPTGIHKEGSAIHIDGYPDAELIVKMPPPLGMQIARLRQHQSDLTFCEQAMQELGSLRKQRPLAAEAIWIAALVKFFSCFGDNKAVKPLSPSRVYRGRPDALSFFNQLKKLRDKHIVHNESSLTYAPTLVVLGKNREINDILSLKIEPEITDGLHLQQFYNLICDTLGFVTREIDGALARGFQELRNMTPEQRAALPQVEYVVPYFSRASSTRSY